MTKNPRSSQTPDENREFFDSLKRDCRWFLSDRPCVPHKEQGKVCASCDVYEPQGEAVLIVKLAAMGDVLRTTCFLKAIRAKHPSAKIHWLTLLESQPLFRGNPNVDHCHTVEASMLPIELQSLPFDCVLCPDTDQLSLALAAGIRLKKGGRRLGFGLDEDGQVEPLSDAALHWFLMGINDERKKANTRSYQSLIAEIFELPQADIERPTLVLTDTERQEASDWLAFEFSKQGADPSAKAIIGLNTGSGKRWPLKQWTKQGQIDLIGKLHELGHQVMLLGGPSEKRRHLELMGVCPAGSCIDAGTANSVRAFAAKLDLCAVLVTGDTLALHIGTALKKQVVALFGPTSHAEIELFDAGTKLYTDRLDCLVCYSNCDKKPNCMDLISVDMVLDSVLECVSAQKTP